jgi:hypothetical protein
MPFDPDALFPPDKYTVRRGVPLLDEHKAKDQKGGKDFDVTADFLADVAKNCNDRFQETGDAIPHVVGHTRGDVGEDGQGEILGYWANLRTAPFFETGRTALHGDLYVLNEQLDKAKKYPRRSVELWRRQRIVDPVSALSASTPERSLGLLLFNRDAETPYRYSIPDPGETRMDNPQPDPNQLAAQMTTMQPFVAMQSQLESMAAEFVSLKQQLASQQEQTASMMSALGVIQQVMDALADEHDADGPADDPRDLLGPADAAPDEAAPADPTPDDQGDRSGPVRFDSAPSGPNSGYIPGTDSQEKTKMQRTDDENEVVKFQKAVEEAVEKRVATARDEKKALEKKLAALEETVVKFARDAKRVKAEKAVAALEAEHDVDFGDGRDAELDLLTELDDESFGLEVERVQKYWRRKEKELPNGGREVEAVKFARTDDKPAIASFADVQKVIGSGLSYEEYLKKAAGK